MHNVILIIIMHDFKFCKVANIVNHISVPSAPRHLLIMSVFSNGISLQWLPPLTPNGHVHYLVRYGNRSEVNTRSDLTHHNLTGLERGVTYDSITVVAVNSAGESSSVAIKQYVHSPLISGMVTGKSNAVIIIDHSQVHCTFINVIQ